MYDAKIKDNDANTQSFIVVKERNGERSSDHVRLSDQCLVKTQGFLILWLNHTLNKNFEKCLIILFKPPEKIIKAYLVD